MVAFAKTPLALAGRAFICVCRGARGAGAGLRGGVQTPPLGINQGHEEKKMLFSLFKSSLFILVWEGDGFVWDKSQIQGPRVTNSESGLSRAQEFYSLISHYSSYFDIFLIILAASLL